MAILRNEYPRPHFRRDNWLSLNGIWEFEFDDNNDGELRGLHLGKTKLSQKINVPFTYNYKESGIGDTNNHDVVWYRRKFKYEDTSKTAVLGFNASDYITNVWINGYHVITHQGGFDPFTVDITKYLNVNDNVIVVKCYDPLDPTIPRGKQSWLGYPFSCWYIPNTGIWQSVWIDFTSKDYIDDFFITPNIDNNSISGLIKTKYSYADSIELKIYYDQKLVKNQCFSLDGKYTRYTVNLMESNFVDEVTYWSFEHPNLYYLDFVLYKDNHVLDVVHTRFGMRKISVENGKIMLNNRPLYQRLILDQGYWKESGLTPPTIDDIKKDIELMKEMGFNGARKHQKFEDPYFYYYADELGFLTWCEMPSAYNFNTDEVKYLSTEWQQIVNTAKKFTSIIAYVPLNESWGVRKILNDPEQQSFARSMYHLTKSIDNSRLCSTNDGWENVTDSDMIAIHDYRLLDVEYNQLYNPSTLDTAYQTFRKVLVNNDKYQGQPVLLTEFGGIAMEKDHQNGNWGYNSATKDENEYLCRLNELLKKIYMSDFQGFCYTQLTDVQQEVNGILDADHKPKVDIMKVRKTILNE